LVSSQLARRVVLLTIVISFIHVSTDLPPYPDQWLVTDEGRIILNDINNAVPLEWNFEKQEYCNFWVNYPGGRFHSPEGFRKDDDSYVDEKSDIWSMGNMIFSLLTGLWPYYDQDDQRIIRNIVMKGIPPYLDPRYQDRSMIEGRLVEVMNLCHKLDPSERVDIFYIVKHLRETLRMLKADLHSEHREV
jgi:serine/threonine protein kinase